MKKVLVTVLASATLVASTSALAWGDREQGIVQGAAGLWIAQQLYKAGNQPQVVVQQPIYQPQPQVVYQPAPQKYCESRVLTDQFGFQREFTSCYYR